MGKEKDKEKQEGEVKGKGFLSNIKAMLTKEPVQVALGVIFIVSGLYLTLAFFSFFFTGWEDQSLLQGDFPAEYLSENIKNWTGLLGARVSDFCINRTFGIPVLAYLAYWFLVGFWLINVRPFQGKMLRVFFICSFLTIWGSLLMGSFIENYDSSFLFLGGEHGYRMNLILRANIGRAGVVLMLILLLLMFSFYAFEGVYEGFINLFKPKPIPVVDNPAGVSVVSVLEEEVKEEEKRAEEENTSLVEPSQQEDSVVEEPQQVVLNTKTEVEVTPETGLSNPINIPFSIDTPDVSSVEADDPEEASSGSQSIEDVPQFAENEMNNTSTLEDENVGDIKFTIQQTTVEMAEKEDSNLYDPTKDLEYYKKPTMDLFDEHEVQQNIDEEEQNQNKNRIVDVLRSFGVEISSIKATVGPTVTLYEVTPAEGVRISKIKNLGDDIALSIAAKGIRIIAPIPGKGTIGIEVPNAKPVVVPMAEIIGSKKFQESKFELPIALGKTITNEVFMLDLCKMPHVLVAGATGQGKSVGLNAIITSLLYKKHPSELKFVMVDPKMVEFSMYAPIEKHFLAKMPDAQDAIITDVKKVVQTLNSLCVEMDNRYELLKDASVRQVKEYNEKFVNRKLNPEKGHHFMPYIVVVIDEFADLIMQVGKEVETPIARIAQKARAVGIHMILATQRPSANIITGVIRANFPARFAFRVSTGLESRVILDTAGADQLIGRGDMLISAGNDLDRVQCALVDTPEVERIARHISNQQGYPTAFILPEYEDENEASEAKDVDLSKKDSMFNEVAELVVAEQMGSTSMIQRKFSIGFNRAGRIMDQLEAAGIVGPAQGSKPRQVLISDMAQLDSILNSL